MKYSMTTKKMISCVCRALVAVIPLWSCGQLAFAQPMAPADKVSGEILAHQKIKQRPPGRPWPAHERLLRHHGLNPRNLETEDCALYCVQPLTVAEIQQLARQGLTIVPDLWIPPMPGKHPFGFHLATVRYSSVDLLRGDARFARVESSEFRAEAKNDLGRIQTRVEDVINGVGVTARTGAGVKVAIADSGLDRTHGDFPVPVEVFDVTDGTSPANWSTDVKNTVSAHGTHVAATLLGRGTLSTGRYKGAAPGASLYFYKIGNDVNGYASVTDEIKAINRAKAVGVRIFSMSYGGFGPYMDGSEQMEQAIDSAVAAGMVVFIAAGNEADGKFHASLSVAPGATSAVFTFTVNNSGSASPYTASELMRVIWRDDNSADQNIALACSNLGAGESVSLNSSGSSVRGTESRLYWLTPNLAAGAAKTYSLTLHNSAVSGTTPLVHCYQVNTSDGKGTFDNPDSSYTVRSPAVADSAIAVGAWTQRREWTDYSGSGYHYSTLTVATLAPFSSLGPRIDGLRKPDLVAPGAATISARDSGAGLATLSSLIIDNDGLNLNGSGPANYYVMEGTSMACPHAAGAAALLLEAKPSLTPAQVKQALTATASLAGAPDNSAGYGLIDALGAVQYNQAPVLASLEVSALPYTENQAATPLTATLTVSDVDSASLASATVSITSGFASGQDVLAMSPNPWNGISATYSSGTGVLTLSGSSTVANYQAALRTVAYQNTSENPSTTTRRVSFKVNDGSADSSALTRNVTLTPVNDPPTLSSIAEQMINEDTATGLLALTIGDVETAAGSLTLSARSTNTTLVPVANILFGGTGANRTVRITPATNEFGTNLVTLTVSDGAASNSTSFVLLVKPVNDPPTLDPIGPMALEVNAGPQTVNLTGISSGAANEDQVLTVTASSSHTGLIPHPTANYTSPNANGTLSFTPVANAAGSAVITVIVQDNGPTTDGGQNTFSRQFTVQVNSLANLAMTQTANPGPVPAGSNLLYRLTVTNRGPSAASGLFVTNALPAPASFVTATASQGTWNNTAGKVVFNLGNLASQASASLSVTVSSPTAGQITNLAQVVATVSGDPDLSDNTATNVTTVSPVVLIAASDPTASETGLDTGTFTVSRVGGNLGSLVVNYFVTGTALPGSDYVALSGTVTIPNGAGQAQILLTPLDDFLVEPDENVIVTLTTNLAYFLCASSNATVTITDNDVQGLVISTTNLIVPEGGSANYTVRLNAQPASPVMVTNTFASGDPDLRVTAGTMLTFNSVTWSNPQPVTLTAAEDADTVNGQAIFTVAAFGLPSRSVTATEADNDQPPLLAVTAANRDFGAVTIGQTNTLWFAVSNAGGLTLTGSATSGVPFSVPAGSPFSLSGGQTAQAHIAFRPTQAGLFSTNVVFTSNGGGTNISVNGTGVASTDAESWVAFNDHVRGSGTGAGVTTYSLMAAGSTVGGVLTNYLTGSALTAQVALSQVGIVNGSTGTSSAPNPGTPADLIFAGKIDWTDSALYFGGTPYTNSAITYTFTGLNPALRYAFRGTAIRGRTYVGRWTLVTLSNAISATPAHLLGTGMAASPGIVTNGWAPYGDLLAPGAQAAFNSGNNLCGDVIGWDDIVPNGTFFTIICTNYRAVLAGGAAVPGGSIEDTYSYAFGAFMLAAVPSPAPVIVSPPASRTNLLGTTATFTVGVTGTEPISYQWRFNGFDLAGATASNLTLVNVQLTNAGSYVVVVTNVAGAVTSAVVVLTVAPFGVLDHFTWDRIDSPQRVDQPFPVRIVAQDSLHNTVSTFSGTVSLSGTDGPATMFSGTSYLSHSSSDSTLGTFFTPNVNLLVSGVVHYGGSKVSLWTSNGVLLASKVVSSPAEAWMTTALDTPVTLQAGHTYCVGYHGNTFFVTPYVSTFQHGETRGSQFSYGDTFPIDLFPIAQYWVDIRYTVALATSPRTSGVFSGGSWDGSLTVTQAAAALTLTANDGAGHGGTSGTIRVLPLPPQVDFTAAPASGARPLRTFFTNLTTGATNYTWEFGTGQTSSSPTPAYTYSNAGLYTVSLTAVGQGGTNRLSKTNFIVVTNPPPVWVVSPSNWSFGTVELGGSAERTFLVTNQGGGFLSNGVATVGTPFTVVSGGAFNLPGYGATNVVVRFTPGGAGSYSNNVVFNISNGGAATNAVTGIAVTPGQMDVSPAHWDFGVVAVGASAQCTFVVTNLGGAPVSGGVASVSPPFSVVAGSNFTVAAFCTTNVVVRFTPDVAVTFTNVVYFLTADGGASSNLVMGAGAIPPQAQFSASPTSGPVPLPVTFTDLSTGTITNRGWDFGDTTTLSTDGTGVTHTYLMAGTNTVVLTVQGPLGSSATQWIACVRATNAPPWIILAPVSQRVLLGGTASFAVTARGTPPLSYQWRKNGTPLADGGGLSGATSNSLTIGRTVLSDEGNYSVVVSNQWGLAASPMAALIITSTNEETWVAFNDHMRGPGTGVGVTAYSTTLAGGTVGGPLTNSLTGTALTAQAALSQVGVLNGYAGASSAPTPGTPADLIFAGKIDWTDSALYFGGTPYTNSAITYTFTGLNPALRYAFRGTAVRGGTYRGRWTLVTLSNAISATPAHLLGTGTVASPGIVTNGWSPYGDLLAPGTQAAFNSGINLCGDVIGWDDIVPNGASFTIICTNYRAVLASGAAVPGGSIEDTYSYAFGAFRLAAVQLAGSPVTIFTPPQPTTVAQGRSATLTVVAGGSAPQYEWFKNGLLLPGQHSPSLTFASAQLADAGLYHVRVFNSSSSTNSPDISLTVTADTLAPALLQCVGTPEYDAAGAETGNYLYTITFSEAMNTGTIANPAHYELSLADGSAIFDPTAVIVLNSNIVQLTAGAPFHARHQNVWIKNLWTDAGGADANQDRAANPVPNGQRILSYFNLPLIPAPLRDQAAWEWDDSFGANQPPQVGQPWQTYGDTGITWKTGRAMFSGDSSLSSKDYGDLPEFGQAAIRGNPAPGANDGPMTTYYRRKFTMPSASAVAVALSLRHVVDDGAVFYLNGLPLANVRLPETVVWNTPATTAPETNPVHPVEAIDGLPTTSLLLDGQNSFAVEVHQLSSTSSDVLLGVELMVYITNFIAVTPGQMAVSPTHWDFGVVAVGASAQCIFVVTNLGGAPVSGGVASVSPPFSVVAGSNFTVAAFGTTNVVVRFTPDVAATFTNVVYFLTADGGASSNQVLGAGAIPPQAQFSASPTSGPVPLPVTFTDLSTGTITNRWWSFGDGATTNTTVANVVHTYVLAGNYPVTLMVSGPLGASTNSQSRGLLATNVAPTIAAQPRSQTVLVGSTATFTVVPEGTPPLGCQWRFSGINLVGQTNATLSLSNVRTNDAGPYTVVVTNPAGSMTSAVATLTVLVPPAILLQPQSQMVPPGSDVVLSVVAVGTAPLCYQWYANGSSLLSGTNSSFALFGISTNEAGGYWVVVTNVAGSVSSDLAVLQVRELLRFVTSAGVMRITNGAFRMRLVGMSPTNSVVIETSTNLATWSPVHTNSTSASWRQYSDPDATNRAYRFYRAKELP